MKINKRLIMSSSIIIIFIIGILLYLILSNPYLNYYNKSDLDTNIYPINTKYEISQIELDKVNNSMYKISLNKEILPITKTKDGSNYLNMASIYEINILKNLINNIYLYNKSIKNKNSKFGIYGENISNDINLLTNTSSGIVQQELVELIPDIKNPKVKESAYKLLSICKQIDENSNYYLNNDFDVTTPGKKLIINNKFNVELLQLENNYKNMEHGSICAKDEWNKLTLKYIKGETEVNSNSNFL